MAGCAFRDAGCLRIEPGVRHQQPVRASFLHEAVPRVISHDAPVAQVLRDIRLPIVRDFPYPALGLVERARPGCGVRHYRRPAYCAAAVCVDYAATISRHDSARLRGGRPDHPIGSPTLPVPWLRRGTRPPLFRRREVIRWWRTYFDGVYSEVTARQGGEPVRGVGSERPGRCIPDVGSDDGDSSGPPVRGARQAALAPTHTPRTACWLTPGS
jgi:hypothetical protein